MIKNGKKEIKKGWKMVKDDKKWKYEKMTKKWKKSFKKMVKKRLKNS